MHISRRHLMINGASFAAAAGCVSLIDEASAQGSLVQRRSVHTLPLNDPVVEALREGVRRLKALPESNPLRWANLARIHGIERDPDAGFCPHGNWYFLPWHRAYMLMYERIIRNVTGFQQFALPYWDWTASRQIPQAFAQATWNGNPNPLYEPRREVQTPSLGDEIVGPTRITEILDLAAFEQFGSSRPEGQSSADPQWLRRPGTRSVPGLENPHNGVHSWVRGHMGDFGSPLDPVFLAHHCNVDRLWVAWRAGAGHTDPTESFWLDMRFENHFYNADGSFWATGVRDMLDPAPLGYSYGTGTPQVSTSSVPPHVSALADLITQVAAGQLEGPGIRVFRAVPTGSVQAPQAMQVPVTVESALLGQVARRPPLPPLSGMSDLDRDSRQDAAARGTRALAVLRNVHAQDGESLLYRVFVDCTYLSASTPISDPHYVGTFAFFGPQSGHAGHGGHGGGRQSILVDLTEALRRVHGSTPSAPGSIRVQVLPVTHNGEAPPAFDPNSRVAIPVAELSVERIEVVFVSTQG